MSIISVINNCNRAGFSGVAHTLGPRKLRQSGVGVMYVFGRVSLRKFVISFSPVSQGPPLTGLINGEDKRSYTEL
jgi:hypothetical protein